MRKRFEAPVTDLVTSGDRLRDVRRPTQASPRTGRSAARQRRWWMAAAAASVLAAAVVWVGFLRFKPRVALPGLTPIPVEAHPIAEFSRFGIAENAASPLVFRGGLVFESDAPHFGGISGLRMTDRGHGFTAVTDAGYWVQGRLLYDQGRPKGIADVVMASVLGPEGKPLRENGKGDIESLELTDEAAYLGFEGHRNGVAVFRPISNLLRRPGLLLPVPQDIVKLPKGRGLEALAAFPTGHDFAGALLAIAERDKTGRDLAPAWILQDGPALELKVRLTDSYDISDAAFLPEGDLLLLERRLSLLGGFKMRLRRIPAANIHPGAVLDGAVILEANRLFHQIDNMEGIAAHRDENGITVITAISDDNFLPVQRKLLLQWELK
ncbi:esterase-like activity of phytase family protein [Methylocaldum szegediense]|uniref:Phytase-like domain-containing protein n=1 Tax=Methylocaldum szegediense TaxID=73780 RepID=A0ABM9HW33_9GAMM|nr:esterase-like activity of phytase family protein [Methylocaldum szegediense]CAI8724587.1 Phytase-like domain-containing protein [Methylocaldum szegediense]